MIDSSTKPSLPEPNVFVNNNCRLFMPSDPELRNLLHSMDPNILSENEIQIRFSSIMDTCFSFNKYIPGHDFITITTEHTIYVQHRQTNIEFIINRLPISSYNNNDLQNDINKTAKGIVDSINEICKTETDKYNKKNKDLILANNKAKAKEKTSQEQFEANLQNDTNELAF